jgi:hypothetical protein
MYLELEGGSGGVVVERMLLLLLLLLVCACASKAPDRGCRLVGSDVLCGPLWDYLCFCSVDVL